MGFRALRAKGLRFLRALISIRPKKPLFVKRNCFIDFMGQSERAGLELLLDQARRGRGKNTIPKSIGQLRFQSAIKLKRKKHCPGKQILRSGISRYES